jgi:hypothetical protein
MMLLVTIFLILWVFWEKGKTNAKRAAYYNKRYALLKLAIHYPITTKNYWDIKIGIEYLRKLKHKEPERTDILEAEFKNTYETYIRELKHMDKFDAVNSFEDASN